MKKKRTRMKYITGSEFRNLGILEEINRRFLHPLGLAMEANVDFGATVFSIQDHRGDPEGVYYGLPTARLRADRARFRVFERERLRIRKRMFPRFVQPI